MARILSSGGVALAGLVTSILTAILVALFHAWTGFNFFTFSMWILIPVGAIGCGFVAASGYYLAAKFLHQRPTKALLVQLVAIAAFTQFLIYWLEYRTLVVEGVNVSDFVSFGRYLDISLTKTHMKLGRAAHIDTGEVGSFGYLLAIIDFIGFIVGGVVTYFVLESHPSCQPCGKYLKTLVKKEDSFRDTDSFVAYYDGEFAHPVDSSEFALHVGTEHSAGKAEAGTVNLETRVWGCPKCNSQAVGEKAQIFNGKEWKQLDDLNRFIWMPDGIDVRSAYGL